MAKTGFINKLKAAIYAKYVSDSAGLGSVINGLYFINAPQSATMPYTVFFLSTETDNTFNEFAEKFELQFNIYSKTRSSEQTGNIEHYLTALFDRCLLSVAGYAHIMCERRTSDTFKVENEWQCTIYYDGVLEKN